jgi:hypothetical protein
MARINKFKHIFFVAIIGTEKETRGTHNSSATLFFEEYPSMKEIKDAYIENNLLHNLEDVIIISFTELTFEQYKKLYPNSLTPEEIYDTSSDSI